MEAIGSIDRDAIDNICGVLGCDRAGVGDFVPIKEGITNTSFRFTVRSPDGIARYIYRMPGVGTEQTIDRKSELAGLELARELGLDDTFVHEDPSRGWKISRFIPDASDLDAGDPAQLEQAMRLCRKLHSCQATLPRNFDYFEEGLKYESILLGSSPGPIPGYEELKLKVTLVKQHVQADGWPSCVSHNDFFSRNFLVTDDGRMRLIDWEYAGMSDIASDIGTFAVEDQLSDETVDAVIGFYLGRPATHAEKRHFWAYIVLAGWCWYVWALERESHGESTGDWLGIYLRYAVGNVDRVLAWYGEDA